MKYQLERQAEAQDLHSYALCPWQGWSEAGAYRVPSPGVVPWFFLDLFISERYGPIHVDVGIGRAAKGRLKI